MSSKPVVLNLKIATGDTRPIFKQIVDEVRMRIARGELSVGAKLPSVRGLAMQLMVNANTVAKAYQELTSQGLVESRQGLGLFVAEQRQKLSIAEQQNTLEKAVAGFVNEVAYLDFRDEDILQQVADALDELERSKKSTGE